MRYIILEKAQAKVGHVIVVNDGEEAEITAVGKDGVTARDKQGKKFQVLHEHVEVKGKSKPTESEEDEGKKSKGKIKPELEVADDEEDKESVEKKAEKKQTKKVSKKKNAKVPPAEKAKMGEVNPSGKEQ